MATKVEMTTEEILETSKFLDAYMDKVLESKVANLLSKFKVILSIVTGLFVMIAAVLGITLNNLFSKIQEADRSVRDAKSQVELLKERREDFIKSRQEQEALIKSQKDIVEGHAKFLVSEKDSLASGISSLRQNLASSISTLDEKYTNEETKISKGLYDLGDNLSSARKTLNSLNYDIADFQDQKTKFNNFMNASKSSFDSLASEVYSSLSYLKRESSFIPIREIVLIEGGKKAHIKWVDGQDFTFSLVQRDNAEIQRGESPKLMVIMDDEIKNKNTPLEVQHLTNKISRLAETQFQLDVHESANDTKIGKWKVAFDFGIGHRLIKPDAVSTQVK